MNILNKIRTVINWLVILFFCYMVLAVFYQVLGRYVFHYKLGIAAETATFAQIWMVLLAAGIAMKKNMHVGVDILLRVLPKKFQKIIIVFSFIFILSFLMLKLTIDFSNDIKFKCFNQLLYALSPTEFFKSFLRESQFFSSDKSKVLLISPLLVLDFFTLNFT